jgi:hypothetical protein
VNVSEFMKSFLCLNGYGIFYLHFNEICWIKASEISTCWCPCFKSLLGYAKKPFYLLKINARALPLQHPTIYSSS